MFDIVCNSLSSYLDNIVISNKVVFNMKESFLKLYLKSNVNVNKDLGKSLKPFETYLAPFSSIALKLVIILQLKDLHIIMNLKSSNRLVRLFGRFLKLSEINLAPFYPISFALLVIYIYSKYY